jgi:hypothetical protein
VPQAAHSASELRRSSFPPQYGQTKTFHVQSEYALAGVDIGDLPRFLFNSLSVGGSIPRSPK